MRQPAVSCPRRRWAPDAGAGRVASNSSATSARRGPAGAGGGRRATIANRSPAGPGGPLPGAWMVPCQDSFMGAATLATTAWRACGRRRSVSGGRALPERPCNERCRKARLGAPDDARDGGRGGRRKLALRLGGGRHDGLAADRRHGDLARDGSGSGRQAALGCGGAMCSRWLKGGGEMAAFWWAAQVGEPACGREAQKTPPAARPDGILTHRALPIQPNREAVAAQSFGVRAALVADGRCCLQSLADNHSPQSPAEPASQPSRPAKPARPPHQHIHPRNGPVAAQLQVPRGTADRRRIGAA
jgi:hypothetical protein